jgi:hypothetical protein
MRWSNNNEITFYLHSCSIYVQRTCFGVMFMDTGDTNFNVVDLNKPITVPCAKYIGYWGGCTGVPIGPHHFITAKHITLESNQVFYFNRLSYTPTQMFITTTNTETEDLAIWRVKETFPYWAPVYTKTNETGKELMVFGRGTQRGASIVIKNRLCGWEFGPSDGVLRWGKNIAISKGALLMAEFDKIEGYNNCYISFGDSGGPDFIKDDDGEWKLAGINFYINNFQFTFMSSGKSFKGAIFDFSKVYPDTDQT